MFAQNWTNTGLITADDNWSGVPGIVGFRGDGLTGSTAVNPQTVLAESTVVDVNANLTSPNTFTTGGVSEFEIANPVVALQGSGTARAPYIQFHLNTTGLSNINVAYNLRDVDGSADNAVQPVALQFRVGSTGNFTNVPAGFVADATTGPSLATLVTPVSATLPAAAENKPLVQVRVITTDAVGSDEWVGIDDIQITGTSTPGDAAPTINAPANPAATVQQDAAPFTVGLTGNDDGGVYNWSATPGTGVSTVAVSAGQGTNSVTYTVTLQAGFTGTATFTASLSDNVNPAATQAVNIQVNSNVPNNPPSINAPPNPAATVNQDAAPFTVNLSGADDNGVYNWSATAGAGVSTVVVSAGQGTPGVTYTVTLQPGYSGTASFTASLSDTVNPAVTQVVNISVTPAPVNHVTISQVYGGGGNSGATYTHDYVELYNPTATPFSLNGWSIQYSGASSTTWSGLQSLAGTIGPGEYYLIKLATNDSSVGAPLPVTPNVESSSINMGGTAGKVALVSNSAPLPSGCTLGAPVVDLVGYGSTSAVCREGAGNAPAPSSTSADFRKGEGAVDSGNNASDFVIRTPPAPRRTAPLLDQPPTVTRVDTDEETGFDGPTPIDGSFNVFFSEPVEVTGAWYDINCASSGPHTSVVYAGPTHWVITPDVNFLPSEQCTFQIFAANVRDVDTNDGEPNTDYLQANYTRTFTVVAAGNPAPEPPGTHLAMGIPSDEAADYGTPNNYLMEKPSYALSYNRDRGGPNWVSWHLSDEWTGFLSRVDTFRPDPAIPVEWNRVLNTDYSGTGFDRGHVVPNADRNEIGSDQLNQATFLMSNMLPQAPDNNRITWNQMEQDLRTIALAGNELYIVAGGAGTGGSGGNGGVTTTIAGGKVTVPAFTWKVALVLPHADGDDISRVDCSTRTIAVIVPNTNGTSSDWEHQYITTVDAVEQLTGYDFFENLPDPIERCVEAGTNGVNPPLDTDADGVPDSTDNCDEAANADQTDTDADGQGDVCDADDDNDGQTDADELACGSDPLLAASKATDTDGDNSPDCVDADDDGDGVADANDAFPLDPTESVDTDGDGIGNNADADDDGDGQTDADEVACGSDPLSAASKATDTDSDHSPDCVDADDDGDGVPDGVDNCPLTFNPDQADFDHDGIGDACDTVTGPPKTKEQCQNEGWRRFDSPRLFNNQGDCIQFVNTGK